MDMSRITLVSAYCIDAIIRNIVELSRSEYISWWNDLKSTCTFRKSSCWLWALYEPSKSHSKFNPKFNRTANSAVPLTRYPKIFPAFLLLIYLRACCSSCLFYSLKSTLFSHHSSKMIVTMQTKSRIFNRCQYLKVKLKEI